MDVSRIEAFNPNRINWKILTAKEIMKYERQGIEVPNVYLQWAQEFLNSVNAGDNDNITYEAAHAEKRHNSLKENSAQDQDEAINENSEDDTKAEYESSDSNSPAVNVIPQEGASENSSDTESNSEEDGKISADDKYKQMRDDGKSYFKIGMEFRKLSREKAKESNISSGISESVSEVSSEESDTMDSSIQDLIAEVEELRSQINSLKNSKDTGNHSMINRLNAQIKSLGAQGQALLASYSGDFTSYEQLLGEQVGIGADAIDYGDKTSDIAAKFKYNPFLYVFGRRVERAGKSAVDSGSAAEAAANDANSVNQKSLSNLQSNVFKIAMETGVVPQKEDDNEEKTTEISTEDNNSEFEKSGDSQANESDKAVTTSNNDGTDTTDKADISIDEILKRKIRKGQNVDDNYA